MIRVSIVGVVTEATRIGHVPHIDPVIGRLKGLIGRHLPINVFLLYSDVQDGILFPDLG